MIQKLDIYYLRTYCLSNNTTLKMQTQGINVKNLYLKKPKEIKLVYTKEAKLLKQKDKKKKIKKYKHNTIKKRKKQTLATDNNTIDTFRKKKKA